VLTFGAVSIAFIGTDPSADAALASNRVFTLVVVLAIYWLATFIALRGLDWVGKVSKWGGIIGTIVPAAILILLAIIYLVKGGHNNLNTHVSFFPDLSNFSNLVLASSIFLFYAGMEMMGIHVMEVDNPKRNYPRAIIIGSLVTVAIFILGTFALGIVVPAKEISLTQTLLIGFDNYFKFLHMSWLGSVVAIALVFGVLAGVLTWVSGPSKGIFTVGRAGYLPPFFQKTNSRGVQRNILLVQGVIVTILGMLFVVMPSVQSFYQILSQLTVLLYLIMYMLMFSSAIVLRYKRPQLERPFRLGRGNALMWILGGLGFAGSLLAFVLSFIPPSQIAVGSKTVWFSVLIVGSLIVVVIPFIIYAMRKPSWKAADADIEPFGE
jgi:putative glutamate/gamma-aminobutyrate antiporter